MNNKRKFLGLSNIKRHGLILNVLPFFLALLPIQKGHALPNNLALTPPMGWNDWNSYFCGINESAVTSYADAIATNGMMAVGYQFINIDDCWQISRDTNGIIVADPGNFPHGMAWLANYVHSKGLKFGLYSDHGTATCQGKPGSYGYEYVDAMTYASWGVDYLKYDSCNVPIGATALADYGRMSDALLKCGRPITFSICGANKQSNPGYELWSPVLGNLWRTTIDIQPYYSDLITHLDPNSATAFAAGPGRWNDPDMMEVGRLNMTGTANQVEFTMWCIMAAPLIMGNNFVNMTAQAKAILTNPEAIAVDQDPAGEQGVKVVNNTGPFGTNEVWSKTLGYDFSTKAVALFNRLGPITNITCYWTNLGLRAGSATVRDLWAHTDLGIFTNSFTATVTSTNVMMLKIVGTPPLLPTTGTNYIDDLQEVYAYTGSGTITNDQSIGGNPIKLGGVTYGKGIGVSAFSGVEYDLGGICSRFQATIGVDDEETGVGAASVDFQVFADGTQIYDSGVMFTNTPAQTIDLDVRGVSRLVLGVAEADDNINNGHADWANASVIVTNTTPMPPYAPTGLTASPGDQISLAWNATLTATNYNIKRAFSSGGPYTNIASTPITVCTDSNVVLGTTYYYVVSAVSSLGEGPDSSNVSVTPCVLPAVPTNVSAGMTTSNTTVTWNAVSGATSYSVWRFTGSTAPTNIAAGVTGTSYSDTTATNAIIYYYFVAAGNACNQGGYSTFVVPGRLPGAPTGLTATAGDMQVNLKWTAVSGANSYNVKRSSTSGGSYVTLQSNVTTTNYLDTAVTNGTTYYYVVSTVISGSEGLDCAPVSATPNTASGSPPSITTQPASQTNHAGQTVTFSVTATSVPPLFYQWRAGATGGGVYTNLIAGGQFSAVTNATLTIANLVVGNGADYVVVLANSNGSITSTVATLTVVTNLSYQATILADHPVAYWPMQEATGPTIHDVAGTNNGTLMTSTDGTSLGNNQHNAFTNGGAVSSDGATYLLGGPGLLPGDTAIYFTNLDTSVNNSQIVVPYNSALDPANNLTAEAWIYVPAYPIGYTKTAFQTVLGLDAFGGAGNGWWMAVETDSSGSQGDMQFDVAQYPGVWLSSPPTSTASFAGKWVHVVEVYTGSNSNLVCYTNGVLMKTVAMTSSYESEGVYGLHKLPFIIGSYSSPGGASGGYNGGGTLANGFERGNFWHGGVSHVAIYTNALSSSQILTHYQVGSTVILPAPPIMVIQQSGANMIVSWTAGLLQKAASVTGPWTDVTNAVSPYTISATNSSQFFRAKL